DRQPKGGGKFPPITGNSKEFGIKGGLFDDKLNFFLAYFTMTQNGYPSFKPTGVGECKSWDSSGQCINRPLEYDIVNGYKSSGYDINIAGKITPKWLVQAGFTKLKIGKPYAAPNSDSELGDELNMDYGETYIAPAKTFKFFTRYDFTAKFAAGIGMRWNSGVKPKPWGHGMSNGQILCFRQTEGTVAVFLRCMECDGFLQNQQTCCRCSQCRQSVQQTLLHQCTG
ncbi:TonB-dependent receptor domain-containing protein, partial [Neisseria bacilliformis]|uniref:TonB-dependent receptor domain-containing protein n=1 Tax=Neisseria bacilliformis TaxID=267212 RepID=UPI00066736D9